MPAQVALRCPLHKGQRVRLQPACKQQHGGVRRNLSSVTRRYGSRLLGAVSGEYTLPAASDVVTCCYAESRWQDCWTAWKDMSGGGPGRAGMRAVQRVPEAGKQPALAAAGQRRQQTCAHIPLAVQVYVSCAAGHAGDRRSHGCGGPAALRPHHQIRVRHGAAVRRAQLCQSGAQHFSGWQRLGFRCCGCRCCMERVHLQSSCDLQWRCSAVKEQNRDPLASVRSHSTNVAAAYYLASLELFTKQCRARQQSQQATDEWQP